MDRERFDDFIKHFEPLYFDPNTCPKDYKSQHYHDKEKLEAEYRSLLKNNLGINKLNRTDYNAEQKVMDNLLKKSIFNEEALAWKAGKIEFENGELKTADIFESGDDYINGYGQRINKEAFQNYSSYLQNSKKSINKKINEDNWTEAYRDALEESPRNIGPVYIINALFFLTGGKAPIYDVFAHKAVKALLLNIAPSEVYLGGNPGKNDIDNVIAMYNEYMLMLKMVFKDYFEQKKKSEMFISRELDRALWVYGHSKKIYH